MQRLRPRIATPYSIALAAIAWAHIPGNDLLSWRESVYQPEVTTLIGVGIVATVTTWRAHPPAGRDAGFAMIIVGIALAAVSAARSADRSFALTYLCAVLSLDAIARWVRGSQSGPAPLVAAITIALLSLVVYAVAEVARVAPSLSLPGAGPGATLGNRNALARCAAIALPGVWWLATLTPGARSRWWTAASALLLAVVIVSRCRVAWLACVTAAVVGAVILLATRSLTRHRRMRIVRISAIILVSAGAIAAPASRALAWSDAPWFSSTARRIAQLSAGSGAMRVEQARALATVIRDHPLLGVGPASLASLGLSANAGGYNTFASSDVTGFLVAFGGLPVLLCVAGAGVQVAGATLGAGLTRRIPLWTTLPAVSVCAAGDATLQLPVPAVIAVFAVSAWLPSPAPPLRAASQWRPYQNVAMLVILTAGGLVAGDRSLRAFSVACDRQLPRLLPASLRDGESPSIAELRRRWVRAERTR